MKNFPFIRKVTFVQAPDIPLTELLLLEERWQDAMNDPEYKVITNYTIMVVEVTIDTRIEFLTVTADSVPASEVGVLRKRIDKALSKPDSIVFTNYELQIFIRPIEGVIIPQIQSKQFREWRKKQAAK